MKDNDYITLEISELETSVEDLVTQEDEYLMKKNLKTQLRLQVAYLSN